MLRRALVLVTFVTLGFAAGLVLTFVARPLSVLVSSLVQPVPWPELAFISWAGLRGAVPIVLATIPLSEGVDDASKLFDIGQKTVGVPKTMDNDLSETDACIGFNSAVSIVVDALDKLHTTASSHHRVMVIEVIEVDWLGRQRPHAN